MTNKVKPANARDLIGQVEVSNGVYGRQAEKRKPKKLYFKIHEESFDQVYSMFKKVLSWFNKNKESSFKEVVIDSEPKFDEHRAMYFSWNYTCALMCEYPEEDVSRAFYLDTDKNEWVIA